MKSDVLNMNKKKVSEGQDLRDASSAQAELVASTAVEVASQGCDSVVSQAFAKSDHHD